MNSAAAPPLSLHPPPPLRPPYNISPVLISVIGALGSIFLVVSYYQLLLRYCSCFESIVRRGAGRNDEGFVSEDEASGSGLDISLIAKIPIVKYSARDSKSGTECSVCLTEFSEGELVRVLPKCRHAFHIACIGFWLNTHYNCPLCRANIARSLFDSPSPEKREVVAAPSGHEIEPRDSHFLAFYDAPAATANAVERPLPRSLSYAGSSHLSPESASSSQWYRRFRWSTRTSSPSEEMRSRLLESEASVAHKDCNERALEVAINFDGPVNISNGGQGASFATKRELL